MIFSFFLPSLSIVQNVTYCAVHVKIWNILIMKKKQCKITSLNTAIVVVVYIVAVAAAANER